MNLCDELTIRMLLERHGFHFSKSMGQNFLIDPQIPADIAAASQADETCGVLEIGPGIGPLTSELAQRAGKVVSIELDRALLPILAETMALYSNAEIVPGDVTRLDLKALIGEKFAGLRPIVCALQHHHARADRAGGYSRHRVHHRPDPEGGRPAAHLRQGQRRRCVPPAAAIRNGNGMSL